MQNQDSPTKIVRYPLAPAGRRIGAKVIDILIVGIIVIGLGFAIFCTDPNFHWHETLNLKETWRYGLFVTLMAVVFFGLMLLLPRLWKKTLGMKMCKLSYVNNLPLSSFSAGLFKHELFVWEVVVFVALIMGWTLTFLSQNKAWSLMEGAMIGKGSISDGANKVCFYVGIGFSTLYTVSLLFLLAIIVGTCIKNKKPAFHDKFSNIFVIHMKQLDIVDKQHNIKKQPVKKINYGLPGDISAESFEEIDKI